MEYGHLGSSGLLVSKIGIGTNRWRIDIDQARTVLDRALDQGVTLIDTADVYNRGATEEMIGEILGNRRHAVVLATKFGNAMGESPYLRGASRRYIMAAAEASLRRLKTDYIDLYQFHAPDRDTPVAESLQALDDLVRQGKVRYIGQCNFAAWQIVDLHWTARTEYLPRPISAQHAFSLLDRDAQAEVLPVARTLGLGFLPYFPLAMGFLTGKYRKGALPAGTRLTDVPPRLSDPILNDANWELLDRLTAFARDRGHTMTELAFAWLLSQPEVSSVIAGATRPEQVDENVAAGGWRLSQAELASVPSRV